MSEPKIIFMTGVSGSGKTVLSGVIAEHYKNSAIVINVGNLLRNSLATQFGIQLIDRNYVGDYFLLLHPPIDIAKIVEDTIIEEYLVKEYEYIIIDGLRHISNIGYLKKKFPKNIHIHVHVAADELTRRLARRDTTGSQKYNSKHDSEMDEAAAMADYHAVSVAEGRWLARGYVDSDDQVYDEICMAIGCREPIARSRSIRPWKYPSDKSETPLIPPSQ